MATQHVITETMVPQCTSSWVGDAERECLLLEHLPQVQKIAAELYRRLLRRVAFEDLVQSGTIGLMEAVQRFDAGRGIQFRSYAKLRIRGAMIDSLREADWAPRHLRAANRRLAETKARLTHMQGADPDHSDVAREMGVSVSALHELVRDIDAAQVRPLVAEEARKTDEGPNPLDKLLRSESMRRVREALDTLTPSERRVTTMYYFEEVKMKEIGGILGVGESRVSQLHASALTKLRDAIRSA